MLIPGNTTVTPAAETVKVNGKDVPQPKFAVGDKVKIPAQQAKAEEMLEGLMARLKAAEEQRDEAIARAKSAETAKAVRKVDFKVSAKGAVSAYGLGRWPTTLYAEQWVRVITSATGMSEEAFWTTHLGKFIITHRDELSNKSDE